MLLKYDFCCKSCISDLPRSYSLILPLPFSLCHLSLPLCLYTSFMTSPVLFFWAYTFNAVLFNVSFSLCHHPCHFFFHLSSLFFSSLHPSSPPPLHISPADEKDPFIIKAWHGELYGNKNLDRTAPHWDPPLITCYFHIYRAGPSHRRVWRSDEAVIGHDHLQLQSRNPWPSLHKSTSNLYCVFIKNVV